MCSNNKSDLMFLEKSHNDSVKGKTNLGTMCQKYYLHVTLGLQTRTNK